MDTNHVYDKQGFCIYCHNNHKLDYQSSKICNFRQVNVVWHDSHPAAWWHGVWGEVKGAILEVMRAEENRWVYFMRYNGKVLGEDTHYETKAEAKTAAIEFYKSQV